MPDISSAPLVPPPSSSLYPQPPPPQQGVLSGGPGQMLDLIGKIQQNFALSQELKAKAAVGQAYQGALNPDGTFDPERLRAGLNNPDANWLLPDVTTHMLAQRGAQFDILAKQDSAARSLIGSLPPNASDETLRHYAVTGARAGIPVDIMMGHVDALMRLKGKERARAIAELQGTALGPAGVAQRVTGEPLETGAPTQRSLGATIMDEAQGPGGGGYYRGTTTGLPPGRGEAQSAEATEGQRAAIQLQNAANEVPQQRTQLDLMRQDLANAGRTFGPTSGYEKVANQIAGRVLGFHPTMSSQEIASLESFDKVGRQIAMSQAGALHATDQTLSTALGANPNTNLSALGNEGIINMLHGNADAISVKSREWNMARRSGIGPDQFYRWSDDFNRTFDPRVFQFMRMTPDQQAKLLNTIPDKQTFERRLVEAERRGWITLPPAPRRPGQPKDQRRVGE